VDLNWLPATVIPRRPRLANSRIVAGFFLALACIFVRNPNPKQGYGAQVIVELNQPCVRLLIRLGRIPVFIHLFKYLLCRKRSGVAWRAAFPYLPSLEK
jgi:hypothetical protein